MKKPGLWALLDITSKNLQGIPPKNKVIPLTARATLLV